MAESKDPIALKPVDFHILLALVDVPRHGYEIMKEVESESGGTVRLEVGTLYRILGRLLDEGLLQEGESDGRRLDYSLTRAGRRSLKQEAERLAVVVDRLRARRFLPQAE